MNRLLYPGSDVLNRYGDSTTAAEMFNVSQFLAVALEIGGLLMIGQ